MKKERNYTVELLRFILAINFCALHVARLVPTNFLNEKPTINFDALDIILVFIALSGYFLMDHFKRTQKQSLGQNTPPSLMAARYLKGRILSIGPIFLLAQFFGFAVQQIWHGTSIVEWPNIILNHLGELCGLILTGFGMGTPVDGFLGEASSAHIFFNQPLWFISGLLIVGYFLYYLLCKCEKFTIAFLSPLVILLVWGSCYQNNINPIWNAYLTVGNFSINFGLINMFCGLSAGCLIWVAVDALKGKEFSKGMRVLLTFAQLFGWFFMMYRAWVPLNTENYFFTFSWVPLTLFRCFSCSLPC